jgi:hypothetical protein
VSNEVWEKAKRRATYEGVTISHVLALIAEGYAAGLLDLPRVQVTYTQPMTQTADNVKEEVA